ncbi:hypothetical protein [Caballeronia sp. dw_19]|uniref:hypothetical protein n=1 Tax=Caballeronia sp. dw_19 TaxID=2719791 RepID=UPI001BD34E51|nr:hypothetical protein [Caballeronia sp. dw_19]
MNLSSSQTDHVIQAAQAAVTTTLRSRAAAVLGALCLTLPASLPSVAAQQRDDAVPLDAATEHTIKTLYRSLIDAENRHDIEAVRPFVWNSSTAVFVAKTATPGEGGWAGFWGNDTVLQHLQDIYKGPFYIAPDYAGEREVALSADVVQTYVPVKITVAYAGQTPVPKPFLMILEWVRTGSGWKMATDIALPIPS